MKITFNSLLLASILLFSTNGAIAQSKGVKKSTTKPASTSGLTTEGANKIIVYTNSVNQFFKTYFNTEYTAEFYNNVNIGLAERGKRSRTTIYDTYRNKDSFSYSLERFRGAAPSQDLVDPIVPPSVIGANNVAFMKEKWAEFEAAYELCLNKHDEILKYLDSGLDLKNPSDEKALRKELDEYKDLVKNLFSIEGQISSKLDDLGDMAEEVTLAKHPMVKEIIDTRKTLRLAQAINNKVQRMETQADMDIEKEALTESNNEMKAFVTKYANYDPSVGQTPQIKYMKAAVSDIYKEATSLEKYLGDFLSNYQEADLELFKNNYDKYFRLMVDDYNSFIQRNNNY